MPITGTVLALSGQCGRRLCHLSALVVRLGPSRELWILRPASRTFIFMRRYRRKQIMPDMVLCPKCHGQRTSVCLACNGTGQRRCDVCGGSGEVEPPPPTAPVPSSAVNEHQPSCFGLEEERGERWKGS